MKRVILEYTLTRTAYCQIDIKDDSIVDELKTREDKERFINENLHEAHDLSDEIYYDYYPGMPDQDDNGDYQIIDIFDDSDWDNIINEKWIPYRVRI